MNSVAIRQILRTSILKTVQNAYIRIISSKNDLESYNNDVVKQQK